MQICGGGRSWHNRRVSPNATRLRRRNHEPSDQDGERIGTGADAAPYFRIFNPVTQGLRFDPEGDYVRRWVPELAALAGADVHAPWEKPMLARGLGYPAPLLDLRATRETALAAYQALRRG